MCTHTLMCAAAECNSHTCYGTLAIIPGSIKLSTALKYILSDSLKYGEIELHCYDSDTVCVYSNGHIIGHNLNNRIRNMSVQRIDYLAMQNHRDFFISLIA